LSLIDNIEELRELVAQTTAGNWEAVYRDDDHHMCLTAIAPVGAFAETRNIGRIRDDPEEAIETIVALTYSQNYPPAGDQNSERNTEFIIKTRNAVPDLLAALDFRPGDAARLGFLLSGEYERDGCKCEQCAEATDMLRRLAGMAAKMEEEKI
jgi:hypothetical protein